MVSVPDELRQRLQRHRQEHVLTWWDRLADPERQTLLHQLQGLDLEELEQLSRQKSQGPQVPDPERIRPIPFIAHNSPDNAARQRLGEEAIRKGRVAVLLVAGGQGSRLGFDHPKGIYPVGPISRKSLFQVHAEKVLGLGLRHGAAVPFLIMTSPATHEETLAYFEQQQYFGLPRDEVFFFCQGTMPSLDASTGALLMETPGSLFLSPDGHGGTLTGLARSGLLSQMKKRGVRHIFYFQVDNPLLKVADPVFLGHHINARAEVSSRVVAKVGPEERMGVFAEVEGRCTIIEYSDLPSDLARKTDADGRLFLWAGSPAIHIFDIDFLGRVTGQGQGLPFHVARKKVPFLGSDGQMVKPDKENALKFERFIFDVLPLADRWTVMESLRSEEFAPLKNADGADSPATVNAALVRQAAEWLTQAGARVPRNADGTPAFPLEICPLFALDAEEVARKVSAGTVIDGPRYFA
jgi:UDP-N-acetylglucosamine/UDP-N-acetylgalactosamine diphosphorylase